MDQELAANTALSHYLIVSKIGAGGMGEVYLAQDTKLDRHVALKILPLEFAEDNDRMNRFVREAKSASALNHPNIITIYEIGETGGTHFIASEYIHGETLHTRLKQSPLDLTTTLEIAIQVASALNGAHKAGIIHRDIKPENVMIRPDGLVKIVDFGIAKLAGRKTGPTDEEAATALKEQGTSPGMIIGTANYMSPEQARGKEVSAQSDIFSFGIVLYEMVTGQRAFKGENALDVIGAILHKEPTQLNQLSPELPHELERIINKTLRKDPEARYQTAGDLLTDLKDAKRELEFQDKLDRTAAPHSERPKTQTIIQPATDGQRPPTTSAEFIAQEVKKHKLGFLLAALIVIAVFGVGLWYFYPRVVGDGPISSIAVLPFENKSGNADSDYLSDGVAESLIYKLSQLPDLRVSPRSSVFRYKGKEIDVDKVGAELGVDAVISGRMVQRGDSLTISVDLVDVRNKKTLWGEQYERKMSDLLATQKEIATTITEKLQLRLSGESVQKLAKKYTDNNEAYEVFLRGQFHYAKRTKDELLQSIEFYQQAIKLDQNFALAYVGMARSYNVMPSFGFMSPKDAMPRAKAAAERALQIDPSLAEAHGALANALALFDWDWAEAEREFKRATELDPNVAEIHNRYGRSYLMPLGRFDEAIAELKRALELEPISAPIGSNLVVIYLRARKNDLALEQAQKMNSLEPNHPAVRSWLSWAYNANGLYSETITLNEKILQSDPTDQDAMNAIGFAYAKAGRRSDAQAVINKLNDIAKSQYVSNYNLAGIYAVLGETDQAIAQLEKAFDDHDRLCVEIKYDFLMDPLREDPRFAGLVKRLNLPE